MERAQLIQDVTDDALGYGRSRGCSPIRASPRSCERAEVRLHRAARQDRKTDAERVDEQHLRRTIDKIVGQVGRRVDESVPMADARLPDGSRVNAVVHPIAMAARSSPSGSSLRTADAGGPEQMASALDLIVHLVRLRDGTRRISHVTEVLGMESDTIVLQDLYLFDYGMGIDDDGRFLGRLKSTGIRPTFSERLADAGIQLEPELFSLEPFARRVVGLR